MMAIVLGCGWLIAANVLALLPSKNNHWARAFGLIALGVPLLGYITYTNGPLLGMIFLIAGMSILRWPVIDLGRFVRRHLGRAKP